MNFLVELQDAGISWTYVSALGKLRENSTTESPLMQLTVNFPGGEPIIRTYSAGNRTNHDVRYVLIEVLRNDLRVSSLMKKWFDSRGNIPVKLVDRLVEDSLVSELIHTALRKCASSSQSVITWNALHHMHPQDNHAFWRMCEATLLALVNENTQKPITRRKLGIGFSQAVTDFLDRRRYDDLVIDGKVVERSSHHKYVLITMYAAVQLTEMDEWLWGWLSWVAVDLSDTPATEAATQET